MFSRVSAVLLCSTCLFAGCGGGVSEGEHQVITIGGDEQKAMEADLALQQKMHEQMLPAAAKKK